MLPDDALSFARAANDLELLPFDELVGAVAQWVKAGSPGTFRDHLVAHGHLSEQEGLTVARAAAGLLGPRQLRGKRLAIIGELGRGANGIVHLAQDVRLGRQVALKVLAESGAGDPEIEIHRFAHEAQVTGQLSHPGIVPVHDLGQLPDGRPYYTMKRVEGLSLLEVFGKLRRRDADTMERWTIPHTVIVLLRIAQALAFAHDRGVVHRDIKPANIMAGDYGEVLVLDWGVARVLAKTGTGHEPVETWRSVAEDDQTQHGTVAGTPAYMAPEQARGQIDLIGPASDVYSVGVVLYEYLCGHRPFRGKTVDEVLWKVAYDPLPPLTPRSLRHPIPPELETLCLKCLEKAPEQRFPDGTALAVALQGYLEGSRRRQEAARLVRRGLAKSEAFQRASAAAQAKEDALRGERSGIPPWAGIEERRSLWASEEDWRSLRRVRDDTYDDALALLQAALENEANNPEARIGIASLYFRKMEGAMERGEQAATDFFRSMVLRHDDGLLRDKIEGDTRLILRCDPEQATITLHSLARIDRRLVPGPPSALGGSPVERLLPAGGYVALAEAPGHVSLRFALLAGRPQRIERHLRLPKTDEVEDGYVPIPPGKFLRGGDPLAADCPPRSHGDLPLFAIARHPVTLVDFSRWLDAEGREAGFSCWSGPDTVPNTERARIPALGVSYEAALAYSRWLSQVRGRRFRLPSHDEWEKAARGVDGRIYPWGNHWESTWCNGPGATRSAPTPRAVGSYSEDSSIYGIFDLAGGVHEWVRDSVPHRPEQGWLRGGSWSSHPRAARITCRLALPRNSRGGTVGFRLVQELD